MSNQLTEAMRRLCEAADAMGPMWGHDSHLGSDEVEFNRALQSYRDAKAVPVANWPTWEELLLQRPDWRDARFPGSRVLLFNNIYRERAARPTLTVQQADEEIRGNRWRNTGKGCIRLWCAVLDGWRRDTAEVVT